MQKERDGFTHGAALEISAKGREPSGGGIDARLAHDLAARIVADYHSADAAQHADAVFRKVVQPGQVPEDMPVHDLPAEMKGEPSIPAHKLLRAIGLASSGAEANRKLKEGAVSINGEKHREMSFDIPSGVTDLTIQVGKKWARVKL